MHDSNIHIMLLATKKYETKKNAIKLKEINVAPFQNEW